jgi:hypothetical protein
MTSTKFMKYSQIQQISNLTLPFVIQLKKIKIHMGQQNSLQQTKMQKLNVLSQNSTFKGKTKLQRIHIGP